MTDLGLRLCPIAMEQLPECDEQQDPYEDVPELQDFTEIFNNEIEHFGVPRDTPLIALPDIFAPEDQIRQLIDDAEAYWDEINRAEVTYTPPPSADTGLPALQPPAPYHYDAFVLITWGYTQAQKTTDSYAAAVAFLEPYLRVGFIWWSISVHETGFPIAWGGEVALINGSLGYVQPGTTPPPGAIFGTPHPPPATAALSVPVSSRTQPIPVIAATAMADKNQLIATYTANLLDRAVHVLNIPIDIIRDQLIPQLEALFKGWGLNTQLWPPEDRPQGF